MLQHRVRESEKEIKKLMLALDDVNSAKPMVENFVVGNFFYETFIEQHKFFYIDFFISQGVNGRGGCSCDCRR